MQTINLKQYYPFCTEDIFVEVSDEIVEAFLLDKRAEAARERKMYRYKAFYSLDCNDGIENAAIGWAQPSPKDYLVEKEELAEYEELIRRLYEGISSLTPAQDVYKRQALSGELFENAADIVCWLKIPAEFGGRERYQNMILFHRRFLPLLQRRPMNELKTITDTLKATKELMLKVNSLRERAGLSAIEK